MVRKLGWITTILIVIFSISIVSWAQEEAKEPDYLREKEQMMESEKTRPVETEESNKPTQRYIKALNEELEELKRKLKQLPPENDEEARDYQERIAEIQKELAQLKRQRAGKLAEAKAKRVRKAAQEKKLSSVEARRRIEELKNDIEEAREKVQELKRTNPDSPSLKELRAHIAERERMIRDLTAQIRKARHQQPPKRTRTEQMQLKIFPLKNIDAETAFKIVREFITDGRGIIVPVFHTNSLIIRDTQKNLRDIETIIEHIDVKGKS